MIRRLLVVAGLVLAVFVLAPGVAQADVTFTDNAMNEFGIDADGAPTGSGSGPIPTAWERFWRTPEGQRIFTFLDMVDVEVIVDVLPADEVGSGESAGRVYGTEKVEMRDATGRPTQIRIKIRNERFHGIDNLADTIWHEFRHAEIDVNGEDHEHRVLDGEHSTRNERFRADLADVVSTSTTLDLDPPTPNYDRIMDRAAGSELRRAAFLFGDILEDIRDSISFNSPTYEVFHIDMEAYGAAKYGYDSLQVEFTFNESIVECGERTEDLVVACSEAGVLDMPPGDVGVFVMDLAGDVPLSGGDHSLIYSVVLDSDADPADNWVFNPPFDWDFFQGTDRWYELTYDHRSDTWFLTVTQLTPAGQVPNTTEPSTVRAVVEGDMVAFFISMSEFRSPEPAYRFSAFGHDGFFSENDRGGDVSGSDPTEPSIILTGETLEARPQQ